MNLIQRVQDILLKPNETWPVIDGEPGDAGSIYNNYLIYLAAIPAVAGFIGLSLVGVGGFGMHIRVPFVSGLVQMVVGYVLSLVAVYVLALIANALAPTFSGSKNMGAALKLVAYGSTAGFVGGVFNLIPMLGMLGLLAAIYSVYLLYVGVPVMMKCPKEKAGAYTAVLIVCGVVAMIVLGAISAIFMPGPGAMLGGMGRTRGEAPEVTIKTPDGEVKIDTSKMEEMARKMEDAGKRMEQAQKSGDTAAAGKAMGDVMGALGGAVGGGAPIPGAQLKALLPESVGALKRLSFEVQSGEAMGMAGSSAQARYADGEHKLQLSINDLGAMGGLAALAGAAQMTVDKETETQIEKVYKQGGRTVKEEYRKDGSSGEITVILSNGVVVEAKGERIDPATLKKQLDSLDLAAIEAIKRPAKP